MTTSEVLTDVLLGMQNLKLSSPLRTDQRNDDDDKENKLEGQDVRKPKTDGKSLDAPVITQNLIITGRKSDCQENIEVDVNSDYKLEGFSPGIPLITSSDSPFDVTSVISEKNSIGVNESEYFDQNALNVTKVSEVNNLGLSNSEQKTSTLSIYDDCIDIIEKTEQDQGNDGNSLKIVDDNLNSTYYIQEIEESPTNEVPQANDELELIACETTFLNLNNTQVLQEVNTTIVKDEETAINVADCGEKLESEESYENLIYTDKSEECNQACINQSSSESECTITTSDVSLEEKSTVQVVQKTSDEINDNLNPECTLTTSESPVEVGQETPDQIDDNLSIKPECSITTSEVSVEEQSPFEKINDNQSFIKSESTITTSEAQSSIQQVTDQLEVDQSECSKTTSEAQSSIQQVTDQLEVDQSECSKTTSKVFLEEQLTVDVVQETVEEVSTAQFPNSDFVTSEVNLEETDSPILNVEASSSPETPFLENILDKTEINLSVGEISNNSEGTMEEFSEKLQQEFSETKLDLKAVQQAKVIFELEQAKALLELELSKREAETIKKDQEIKTLKEQLKEKEKNENSINEKDEKDYKDRCKELEEHLKCAKAKEVEFVRVLGEYEKTIASRFADFKKLKEEFDSVNRHLANSESSMVDLLMKYEKAKSVILGYKANEEKLKETLAKYEETFVIQEGRYESFKAHVKSQFDKGNLECMQIKENAENETTKLKVIIKRLEINLGALRTSLDQKTKECSELATLWDEFTGNEKFEVLNG